MKPGRTFRAKILVLSDAASEGRREDLSGPELRRLLEAQGWQVVGFEDFRAAEFGKRNRVHGMRLAAKERKEHKEN